MNQDQNLNISKGYELNSCVGAAGDKQGLSRGNFNTSKEKKGERNRRADVSSYCCIERLELVGAHNTYRPVNRTQMAGCYSSLDAPFAYSKAG